jgi:Ca2+-binding EF-hand superfamily protein
MPEHVVGEFLSLILKIEKRNESMTKSFEEFDVHKKGIVQLKQFFNY